MSEPVIVIDTREQRPWDFPENVRVTSRALPFGDYALDGDGRFAIERKSMDDFVGTLFQGWERFKRELARMKSAGCVARVIVVEADLDQMMFREDGGNIIPPEHSHPMVTPQAIVSRVSELTLMGVSVLFACDASHAAYLGWMLLMKRWQQTAMARMLISNTMRESNNGNH